MVEKQLKSITFPGINESYFIPDSFVAKDDNSDGHIEFLHYIPEQNVVQIDKSLNVGGAAAEAAATGQRFRDMETLIGNMSGQGDFVAPVLSVNGKTGTVDLSATDVGAVPATGGNVSGYLDFRDTCTGLSWTTADGTIIHLRPYSPTNEFQLTMQNPTKGIGEYGAITINTDGHWGFSHADNVRNAIGAAPAGYGLGTVSAMVDNPDDVTVAGLFQFVSDEITGVNQNWLMISQVHIPEYIVQTAIHVTESWTVQRVKLNGVWQPWEWVNPPMYPGIEYRTTERWNGKPVYTIVIDCGAIPNDSSKVVAHGISGITQVLRTTGTRVGSGGDSVPSWYWSNSLGTPVKDNMEEIGVMGSIFNIHITSVKYPGTETLTVQMWYVK